MSDQDDMNHATINRAGEIDFPLYVKVLAWIMGIAIPLALAGGVWVGNNIFDMSVRIARMESSLQAAGEDRYRASQAIDAHSAIMLRIEMHDREIRELQRLHGRAN